MPRRDDLPAAHGRIIEQVLSGKVTVEGISCASCPWSRNSPMILRRSRPITDGRKTMYVRSRTGRQHDPYLLQSPLYKGANFCTSCHFEKLRDNRSPTVDCSMGRLAHGWPSQNSCRWSGSGFAQLFKMARGAEVRAL